MEISNINHQISNEKDGYTLIEILVVLTIIGLIFAFGYANFRDFSRRQAVASAAKLIQGDLRFAQGNAITGQKPSGCNETLSSYAFRVISESQYVIRANCGSVNLDVKTVDMSSDIILSIPSPNPLKFKVLGQGTNIGATDWTLVLTQNGTANTATITVTAGGEIK